MKRLGRDEITRFVDTQVLVVDEVFMAHCPWTVSLMKLLILIGSRARLVLAGDDAQCLPVVTTEEPADCGLTCSGINPCDTIKQAFPPFPSYELLKGWRFIDDEAYGDFVDTNAEGKAPLLTVADFT